MFVNKLFTYPRAHISKSKRCFIMKFSYEDEDIRSSRPEVFCKKGILRNFSKFTGKHLCQSLLFNNVAGLRPATLFKKRLWHRCFPVNFAKFLRTPFFIEHLWWLLLYTHSARLESEIAKHIRFFPKISLKYYQI